MAAGRAHFGLAWHCQGGRLGLLKLGSGTAPSNSDLEIGLDEAGFRDVSGLEVGRAKSDLKIRHLKIKCRKSVSKILLFHQKLNAGKVKVIR